MAPTYPAPTHRHRSKSAPRAVRGRSPNPKELKKAAKAAKAAKAKPTKAKADDSAFVTPPARSKVDRSSSSSKQVKKKLKFGEVTTTDIVAENRPGDSDYPTKTMDSGKANKIVDKLKKDKEPLEPNRYIIYQRFLCFETIFFSHRYICTDLTTS